MLEIEVVEAHP